MAVKREILSLRRGSDQSHHRRYGDQSNDASHYLSPPFMVISTHIERESDDNNTNKECSANFRFTEFLRSSLTLGMGSAYSAMSSTTTSWRLERGGLVSLANVVGNLYGGGTTRGQSRAGAASTASCTQGRRDSKRILLSDA